ncbi:MAG: hypothetical protein OJF58_003506 [Enhydrobacter sp.]|nr:MAG: hypothetical protein OJF58_003506 [Enhydrobacter sp.]
MRSIYGLNSPSSEIRGFRAFFWLRSAAQFVFALISRAPSSAETS